MTAKLGNVFDKELEKKKKQTSKMAPGLQESSPTKINLSA
jgi:hypothetical protein